jgi:uncharacterized protein YbjT (DUF2867 family)
MDHPAEVDLPVPMTNIDSSQSPNTPSHSTDLTLVVGGTGKTGRRVAARLGAAGRHYRTASRAGAPRFDWAEPATWAPALHGASSVYLTYAPDAGFPGAAETIGAFAAEAITAGARHLVLLTGRGEDGARRSEAAVQESGAEWTIIRSSFFAQNFSEDFLAEAVRDGMVAFPADQVREPFIDIEDIADVAFAALTEAGHMGRIYEVTGPRLLAFADAVAEISTVVGRDIAYLPIPLAAFETGMTDAGVPPDFAAPLTALFADVLDGRNEFLSDGVQEALGRPPRDFADFARRAAATGCWDTPADQLSIARR